MKTEIPEALKADLPPNLFGKILGATPVVMTVIATMLAGLASSEMTKAQYDRSLAAQQQAKAGDQWSFFQAKRMRGALQRTTLDLLQATAPTTTPSPAEIREALLDAGPDGASALALLDAENGESALVSLLRGQPPAPPPAIAAALDAMENLRPDAETAALMGRVNDTMLTDALLAAKARSDAHDNALQPIGRLIDALDTAFTRPDGRLSPTQRGLTAARLRFAAARYDTEARLNQTIANLYELQVRKNNLSAERHHARSQRFFFGMLGAQMAVIISTFAIAARKRNLLWSLAAAAGVAALLFASYVFLFI